MNQPTTYFIDVDGTIFKHRDEGSSAQWLTASPEVLPGVIEWLDAREKEGCRIVLCTARKESCRLRLVRDLERLGVYFDQLVMGCTNGPRVVINDGPCSHAQVDRNGRLP